ncbi:MAG: sensor histidine kinase [Bacteroidales bacterium]|nr:sensor histidine kinase [Bacteroidales bacterium]
MPKPSIQISNLRHSFSSKNALWIALVGGILLTGIITLAHTSKGWVLDNDFHIVYSLSSNVILLFLILLFSFAIIKSHLTLTWKYSIGIIGSIIIAVVLSTLSGWLHSLIYNDILISNPASINLTRDIAVAIIAILISLILYSITRRLQMNIDKEQLQNENLLVRYEALENQLDPHFLFNSLNTLSGLIGNDDTKAQQYLQQLASTYRYIMQGKRLVTLEEELDFVHSYCQMMSIRYGENLRFEQNIDTHLLHHTIIPISIQLLIENALKHNVVSSRYPLTVHIETTPQHTIRVSNQMRPKQEYNNGTGLGLANLAKRYRLLCRTDISITDTDNTFSVEVPLIDPAESAKILSISLEGVKRD